MMENSLFFPSKVRGYEESQLHITITN